MEQPLPNELVDCIIKNLYSDIPSLLSCALVGRAWVRSSQRGIFRNIVLRLPLFPGDGLDAYLHTTRKLVASFDSTPRLASYVRSLELERFLNKDEFHHDATANVIRQLSSLKHLNFGRVRWAVLSPTLKTALAGLFRTPSLTELSLFDIFSTDLIPLLNQIPKQLKGLHLTWIHLDGLNEKLAQDNLPPKSIQLEKLMIRNCTGNFMDWFLKETCLFETRNLQSLDISPYKGRDMDRYLRYVGRSLREFAFDISSASSDCLTYTPNLRILHLHLTVREPSSPVPMICTIFESLFNPNGNKSFLQCLRIDLIFDDTPQLVAHLDRWAEIDELLNRPELSLLERVDVNLLSETRSGLNEVRASGNLLRGKLRILEASGKLYIHYPVMLASMLWADSDSE